MSYVERTATANSATASVFVEPINNSVANDLRVVDLVLSTSTAYTVSATSASAEAYIVTRRGVPPSFSWYIPKGSPAVGVIPATGNLLSDWGIKIFGPNNSEIFDSGYLGDVQGVIATGTLAKTDGGPGPALDRWTWTPNAATWGTLNNGGPLETNVNYRWIVYGIGKLGTISTGDYWSDARNLTVNP